MTPRLAPLGLLLLLALAAPLGAEEAHAPWQPGDRVEPFELADAHGETGRVDEGVRLVLFTADMDAGKLVQEALSDSALQDLAARGAVYAADVSRMPALVTRLFALPSIRRRPYRTLLDTGPGPTTRIPREAGQVTLVTLDRLTVTSVRFAGTAAAVAAALRGEPQEAPAP
jgi:hypothetical protein